MRKSNHTLQDIACRHLIRAAAGVAVTMFVCAGIAAQQLTQPSEFAAETEAEEPRRYAVEFIIFEYNASTPGDTEVFLPDPLLAPDYYPEDGETSNPDNFNGLVDATNIDALEDKAVEHPEFPVDAESEFSADETQDEPQFSPEELILDEIPGPQLVQMRTLNPEQFSLVEAYERLVRLDAYSPLLHAGWTQTAEENGEIRAIKLRRLGDPPLRLDGTMALYLGRYLHLVVDLELEDRASAAVSSESTPYFGDAPMRSGYGFGDYSQSRPQSVYFRIDEDRIFRNGELRYFDHPKFGVLAKVSRVEEDGSVTEANDPPVAGGPSVN